MAYFDDSNGGVIWYDDDQIAEGRADGLTEITEAEKDAIVAANIPEPTVLEQIEALEATITLRNYREAIMGDSYALGVISDVDSQIAVLRSQL